MDIRLLAMLSAASMLLSGIGFLIDSHPDSMGSKNVWSAFRSSSVQCENMQRTTVDRKVALAALHMHFA